VLEGHGGSETVLLDDARESLATLPILVLNAHSRCNCRCVMCDIWKRDAATEVTAADLQRHRESMRRLRVEWVVLSGGEPLMHSDLGALCTFFRELDIRLTLLTTGLLLARRASEVAAFFEDIIVSLDGPRPVHDSIRRVNGSFDLIQSGIAAIRTLRPGMQITARTTVQKQNHAHLLETMLAAHALGFDGISFLAADLTSEAFNRPLLWPAERQNDIGLSADEVKVLAQSVEDVITGCAADDAYRNYVAESPAKLRKIVTHFRASLGDTKFESPPCNAPWVSAVIEADGNVRPCFFHRPVGSTRNNTLEEIVNGEEARRFRSELDVGSNPVCRRCVCSLYRA
jgi:Fe-coproporphyrin III synthase